MDPGDASRVPPQARPEARRITSRQADTATRWADAYLKGNLIEQVPGTRTSNIEYRKRRAAGTYILVPPIPVWATPVYDFHHLGRLHWLGVICFH
jgi:hypothetical protein